jgi:hypothetical protein
MSTNKFDWDDDGDFRDIPDEVAGAPAPFSRPPQVEEDEDDDLPPPPPAYEEDEAEEEFEEEDFSSVLSDARLRLEQGRLYEMIMNHELFDGVDATPRAIKSVQKQIRQFAKEQMEVMLGMRQAPSAGMSVSLPFNSLEVEALKAVASAATQGATQSPDVEEYIAPIAPSRKAGLNRIGEHKPAPRKAAVARPLPAKAKVPVKRERSVKVDPGLEAELRSRGIEREYIEEAKRQVAQEAYRPLAKDPSQMTRAELEERNRDIAARTHTQVKSPSALPQPSAEHMEAVVMARAASAASHPSMIKIMDLLNRQPTRK